MAKELSSFQSLVLLAFMGLSFCFSSTKSSAQNTPVKNQKPQVTEVPVPKIYGIPSISERDSSNTIIANYPEVMPVYKHGKEAGMYKFIAANLKLVSKPEKGVVIYAVVVGTDGKVSEPELLKGLNPETDKEVLRVIRQLEFIPGKQNFKVVQVRMPITVRF